MKPMPIALLSSAAAGLIVGVYLTYAELKPPAGVALSGSTAATAWRPGPTDPAGAHANDAGVPEGTTQALAALRQEVAYIKATLSALQQQTPTAEAAAATTSIRAEIDALWRHVRAQERGPAAAISGESDSGDHPRADPLSRAEAERQRLARLRTVESAFEQEPLDPQWSSQAALTVQQALVGDAADSVNVQAIECRSQTCRVEATADNAAALTQWIPGLAERLAETLPSITANQIQQPNGAATLILYLSRHPDESSAEGG